MDEDLDATEFVTTIILNLDFSGGSFRVIFELHLD